MNILLDIIGSTVVGGLILLLLFQINSQSSTNSANILISTFSSRNSVDAGTLLEYDICKLGYRVSSNVITIAEEHKIEFLADLYNDGIPEKILYSLGNVNEVTGTPNPNDCPLYRKVDNSSSKIVSVVRDFNISYFDAAGIDLSYSFLNNQTNRNTIYGTRLYLKFESSDPSEGIYPFIEFKRTIVPKNLYKK